jgi:hypothetical protein
VPIASALRDRIATATGFDRTLLLRRYETAAAAVRFLDDLVLTPPPTISPYVSLVFI